MKQLSASVLVGLSLLSSAAFAHTSLKGEAMPMVYNWTGFYAGLNLGAVNHTMNVTDMDGTTFLATIQQVSNPKLTGGLQVGYRRQLDLVSVPAVYGLELSANFSDAKFKNQYGSSFALYQLDAKNELKTLCLLQLMGGIASDRVLLFLAAGLSWSDISGSMTSVNGVPFFNSVSFDKKQFGTAFGAGIEYAFTDVLSARVKVDAISTNRYSASDDVGDSFQVSNSIVQATFGLNYKFA